MAMSYDAKMRVVKFVIVLMIILQFVPLPSPFGTLYNSGSFQLYYVLFAFLVSYCERLLFKPSIFVTAGGLFITPALLWIALSQYPTDSLLDVPKKDRKLVMGVCMGFLFVQHALALVVLSSMGIVNPDVHQLAKTV